MTDTKCVEGDNRCEAVVISFGEDLDEVCAELAVLST